MKATQKEVDEMVLQAERERQARCFHDIELIGVNHWGSRFRCKNCQFDYHSQIID